MYRGVADFLESEKSAEKSGYVWVSFLRKNNAKLTPSFRQVLFPKKLLVLTGLTFPTFKEGFGLVFLRFKKRQFRTFTESFKIIPYSLLLNNPLPSL